MPINVKSQPTVCGLACCLFGSESYETNFLSCLSSSGENYTRKQNIYTTSLMVFTWLSDKYTMFVIGKYEALSCSQSHSRYQRMRAYVLFVVVRVWLSHSPQTDSQILTLIASKV